MTAGESAAPDPGRQEDHCRPALEIGGVEGPEAEVRWHREPATAGVGEPGFRRMYDSWGNGLAEATTELRGSAHGRVMTESVAGLRPRTVDADVEDRRPKGRRRKVSSGSRYGMGGK
jgi:hypothetical protein